MTESALSSGLSDISNRNNDDSWQQSFPPGISTAFLVISGAVYGLLGARSLLSDSNRGKEKRKFTVFHVENGTEGSITMYISPRTPRPLRMERLHQESDLLRKTLQTIVDRALAEGLDIQLYSVPTTKTTATQLGLDKKEHPNYVQYLVEEYSIGTTIAKRPFYARTDALVSVTLNRVEVNQETRSLSIAFTLVETMEKMRLAEPIAFDSKVYPQQKFKALGQPRILQIEGHEFYDRLEPYWWRLPMVHFWLVIAGLYAFVTAVLVLPELGVGSKFVYPSLQFDSICSTVIGAGIGIAFTWTAYTYFAKTGVIDRVRMRTLHLSTSLDNDTARAVLLVLVSFVPLLQPIGFGIIADLKTLSVDGIDSAAVFVVKASVAVFCLVGYPVLSFFSALTIFSIFANCVYFIMITAASCSERADTPLRERRRNMLIFLRRICILLLTLCVYFWYYHLANVEHSSSALVVTYWVDFNVFIEFGIMASVLVLAVICSCLFAVFGVAFHEFRRLQQRLRNRLPRWRL